MELWISSRFVGVLRWMRVLCLIVSSVPHTRQDKCLIISSVPHTSLSPVSLCLSSATHLYVFRSQDVRCPPSPSRPSECTKHFEHPLVCHSRTFTNLCPYTLCLRSPSPSPTPSPSLFPSIPPPFSLLRVLFLCVSFPRSLTRALSGQFQKFSNTATLRGQVLSFFLHCIFRVLFFCW